MNNPNELMTIFLQMMGMGSNPQQIMQNIAINSNPESQRAYKQFLEMKKSGRPMEEMVIMYAKEHNFDLTPVMNVLRANHRI